MKTLLSLALLAAALLQSNGATYLLLSQTNAFAAGITNEAKAYTDAHNATNAANWTTSGPTGSTLAGTATVGALVATNSAPGTTPLTVSQLPLTGAESNSAVNLSTTWNTTGNPSALKLVITDTASGSTAKAIEVLGGAAGTAALFSVTKGGRVTAGELFTSATGVWLNHNASTLSFGSAQDAFLLRDAANTLALRNGANAQALNVYNTWTDASNWERGSIYWSGNTLLIGADNLGTGVFRPTVIRGSTVSFSASGSTRWRVDASGHFVAVTDNTYDIGASSATRPRSVFVGPSGGFGSSATNTTVVVSATGATNTLSVNTILYVTAATGASLTDNAGTTEFSGVTIAAFTPIRLQPGGKFVATGVTYATGTSSHAW